METIECIKTRRSVREYSANTSIDETTIKELISIASWAPSGKNMQPWRVKIVTERHLIKSIADMTPRNRWIAESGSLIIVYLDQKRSYDYVKDVQACGAFMQTFMLAAHSMNIDTCWVGGMLNKAKQISSLIGVDDDFELMGLITIGIGISKHRFTKRLELSKILL